MYKNKLCKSIKINKISLDRYGAKNFTFTKYSEMTGYSSVVTGAVVWCFHQQPKRWEGKSKNFHFAKIYGKMGVKI
jgi:hypothetical protein